MDGKSCSVMFALLRSAIGGKKLSQEERECFSAEMLPEMKRLAAKHDLEHLLAQGLKQNGLMSRDDGELEKSILKAIFRYQRLEYDLDCLCKALEKAKIPFLPLKGSVLRRLYPEGWMRVSCDIDVLIHKEDMERVILYLTDELKYTKGKDTTHDVSLYTSIGNHVELHFALSEVGQGHAETTLMESVWDHVTLCRGYDYRYEMSDSYFYFYHIAHMAKHFVNGGCGIRPLIDLWILEHAPGADRGKRDELLSEAELLAFAEAARMLSAVWFDAAAPEDLTDRMQEYLLTGGVYGSTGNRVAAKQLRHGGRIGYLLSRLFLPYDSLKWQAPILIKYRWLMPVMQVRRWFKLFKPEVVGRAKNEITQNCKMSADNIGDVKILLEEIGLK